MAARAIDFPALPYRAERESTLMMEQKAALLDMKELLETDIRDRKKERVEQRQMENRRLEVENRRLEVENRRLETAQRQHNDLVLSINNQHQAIIQLMQYLKDSK